MNTPDLDGELGPVPGQSSTETPFSVPESPKGLKQRFGSRSSTRLVRHGDDDEWDVVSSATRPPVTDGEQQPPSDADDVKSAVQASSSEKTGEVDPTSPLEQSEATSESNEEEAVKDAEGSAITNVVSNIPGVQFIREGEDEGPNDASWKARDKHVFVLTDAGKPIFSRYGDESKLAGFMGVLQAMISFAIDEEDEMRYLAAGNLKAVFMTKGPIYLVCVSNTREPFSQLEQQLTYLHSQIISIVTAGVERILETKRSFDLRNLLGGTDKFLASLSSVMDRDLSIVLNAVHCLRLPFAIRNTVGRILQSTRPPDLLFSLLLAKHQLVTMVRPKKHALQPADLHIILNFVYASQSLRSTSSWTPLCLPMFNDQGFLHAYVCFIAEDICLILITTKPDNVYDLAEAKDTIVEKMESSGALQAIEEQLKNQYYSAAEVRIPGLLHFAYKAHSINQFTAPALGPPYNTDKSQKRLFRLYQHIYDRVYASNSQHKVYYSVSNTETIMGWVTQGFQLYTTFGPLEPKHLVIRACNQLLRWIKQSEHQLFIMDSPTWI
eukprot:TRINITY_DN14808_c0_g1_i1.p1 TRINITY_DN14808_c0_g1~~TRINITY_DN14808_c0_g1_i1.p1  ORF type:complete len:551 (+),score=107.68 TRINITY_DN14808_c0_g1_i1:170-1822(+)